MHSLANFQGCISVNIDVALNGGRGWTILFLSITNPAPAVGFLQDSMVSQMKLVNVKLASLMDNYSVIVLMLMLAPAVVCA